MSRNITAAEAIKSLQAECIDSRTIEMKVESDLPLHLLWPYVRANFYVPDKLRSISTVFSVPTSGDNTTVADARQALRDDVLWREDPGHIGAARYAEGWVFLWRGRQQ